MPSISSSTVDFVQAGSGTVTRTVEQELRETITPFQFGALGGGADDTVAVQEALDYAKTVNGVVELTEMFSVSAHVLVRNGVRGIVGHGEGGLVSLGGTANTFGIVLKGKTSRESDNVHDCVIEGVILKADAFVTTNPTFGIYGQNPQRCTIKDCRILGFSGGGAGILIRSFSYEDGPVIPSADNLIIGNYVKSSTIVDGSAGIQIDTTSGSIVPQDNRIIGNEVTGFQYSISLGNAVQNTISSNRLISPLRCISLQNEANDNIVSDNICSGSDSSAIHMNGSSRNLISNNRIDSVSVGGEGLIQCYIGSKDNLVTGNLIKSQGFSATEAPLYALYAGSEADGNVFSNNVISGRVLRAYICVESAWRYVPAPDVNYSNYAYGYNRPLGGYIAPSAGTRGVVISGNRIDGTSAVPAIALIQSNAGSNNPLTEVVVSDNVVFGNSYSHQLYLYEDSVGALAHIIVSGNSFDRSAPEATYAFPRKLDHFSAMLGNNMVGGTEMNYSTVISGLNGWSFTSGSEPPRLHKTSEGRVFCEVTITGGTTADGTTIVQLPTSCWPDRNEFGVAIVDGSSFRQVRVTPTAGRIMIEGGAFPSNTRVRIAMNWRAAFKPLG